MHDRGYPSRAERLPLALEAVNAESLGYLLALAYPGVVIEEMKLVRVIPGHTTKARLELRLNRAGLDAGLPNRVCLKANLTGDPLSSEVCANEARFYRTLRGRLELPAPRCYFADWDDDSNGRQGLLILEDLVPLGGEFGTSAQPIGIEDISHSVVGLARLHGKTWGHPELSRHRWLQTAMAPQTTTDDYWGLMPQYAARFNALPERLAILPEWIAENPQRLRSAFFQLCAEETGSTAALCLVHGDAHLGNSYRRPNGERIWFDWQIVRKGRPMRDYTYFVVGSMRTEDRRKAERDLLKEYCAALGSHGVHLDQDAAWKDYRRWVIWGIIAWQLNINPNEATMPTLERFCRAAEDLEVRKLFRV